MKDRSKLDLALRVCLVLALIVFAGAGASFAQEDAAAIEAPGLTIGGVISNGGFVGYLILGLSVLSMALIIEHFVSIRRDKLAPPQVIDEIESLFEEENYQESLELCEAEPTYLTNVVAAALPRINAGFNAMEQSIQEMGEEEAVKLHQKIGWLSLIGSIAPMLGLLGTVSGMMKAFNIIAAKKGAADPSDLASGISEALVTTFLGLLVAIPSMTFFFFFRSKVIKMVLEIGAVTEQLFDRFRPHE